MVVNTHYKDNLKAVMQVSKKYTDDKIEQALELLEDYELSSETISQTSQTATAPSDVRASSLIEVGGNCVKYAPSTASDNSVAYKKSIPDNTFNLLMNKIGSKSYKSENLAIFNDDTQTISGITFTRVKGSLTMNGTSTASINYNIVFSETITPNVTLTLNRFNEFIDSGIIAYLMQDDFTAQPSTYQSLDAQNKTVSFTPSKNIIRMIISIPSGTTLTNAVIKPMLVLGSTAPTNWKQGFTGIRDTAVSQLIVSANLLKTTIESGAFDNANGAKSSNNKRIRTAEKTSLTAGTYTISFSGVNSVAVYIFDSNDVYKPDDSILTWQDTNSLTFTISYDFKVNFLWRKTTNDVITPSDMTSVLLNKGSTIKPNVVLSIPSQIQALDGYGVGYDTTDYNFVDFKTKEHIAKCLHFVLNKTDYNWQLNSSQTVRYISDFASIIKRVGTNTDMPQILCDKLNKAVWDDLFNETVTSGISISSNGNIGISISDYENLTTLDVVFLLATPIETDVSQYLTDFNPIETNDLYGEIEFVNTYNQDMPNEISFVGTIKETLVTSFTIGSETTNITDSIESDGWSVSNSIYNYRSIRDKERHKVVGKVDLGTLNWTYNSNVGRFGATDFTTYKKPINNNTALNGICDLYTVTNWNDLVANNTNMNLAVLSSSNQIIVRNTSYTDATAFKSAMSGVYLYFELATPEVTPLDVDTDFHYIDLESGETITFNNANNQACHNTIRYSIMEEKI